MKERALENILHMHGELRKARCIHTSNVFHWEENINVETSCPCCHRSGNLRPHIVWFGEMPFHLDQIELLLSECDLFLCIGTSGHVYPAANFVQMAKLNGAYCIEINKERTNISEFFDEVFLKKAGEGLPFILESLIK